jgi:hypothetical protein
VPKQLAKVEFLNNLARMLTNDAGFPLDIKSKIAMAKSSIQQEERYVDRHSGPMFKKLVQCNI